MKAWLRPLLPRALKPRRILAGPLAGHRIVTSWHDYPAALLGRTELQLLAWFAANVHSGETWLDVGAHYGYTALALARLAGPGGHVFAFEPHAGTAGCLARTREVNGCRHLHVVPFALGRSAVPTLRALPVQRGMIDTTLASGANQPGTWDESFVEVALDTAWPGLCGGDLPIHGIKIDVQGMEIDAIEGMHALLRRYRPRLVVEVHAGVDRGVLLDLLERAGYDRRATPVEPLPGEVEARLADNRSYAFSPGC